MRTPPLTMVWQLTLTLLLSGAALPRSVRAVEPTDPVAALEQRLPAGPEGFDDATGKDIVALASSVEQYALTRSLFRPNASKDQLLGVARFLLTLQRGVDAADARLLEQRTRFTAAGDSSAIRLHAHSFLLCAAALTDLSGRIRYLSFDVLNNITAELGADQDATIQLIDLLTEFRSSVGAAAMAPKLFDPVAGDEGPATPASPAVRRRVLDLIRVSRQYALDAELARFVRVPGQPPDLLVAAANTFHEIGLPQTPRPGGDPTLPKPEITADELYQILKNVDPSQLSPGTAKAHSSLLAWLDVRRRQGVVEDSYRLGTLDVRPGDWLLMRNPSPYNLFTDLSPGLYTHVGVVAVETGSDAIRRFLVVDLPERGNTVPATTFDTYVKRTLNYTVLRDRDGDGAARMARAAADIIDNPSKFDLRFRTDAIERLKGQKLHGALIQGYCAGLLLLCAQESGQPRNQFFPLGEHPAGGSTLANLAQLGISMEKDFLSPTAPLFSSQMTVLGGRDPLYDPGRQIEEAVYDHFAWNMANGRLVPSPDWYQSLRQNLAEASKGNPLLAKALANAAGVNENMDLVAAAKLGAVVESLDEIAYGASGEFAKAREAIVNSDTRDTRRVIRLRGPRLQQQQQRQQKQKQQQQRQTPSYLTRHADLVRRWNDDSLTPRQLREALVDYYITLGNQQLDDRFFRSSSH